MSTLLQEPKLQPADTGFQYGDVRPESPWLGLRSFSSSTCKYFFGRDREINELSQRLGDHRLTILYGQSGLGKTSLLKAGIIPRLQEFEYTAVFVRFVFDSDAPSLEQQVINEIYEQTNYANFQVSEGQLEDIGLWEALHDPTYGLVDEDGISPFNLVLIFDQFEEIQTLGQEKRPEDAQEFMETISAIIEDRPTVEALDRIENDDNLADRLIISGSPLRIIISLRDDYLHWLERWRKKMPSMINNRYELQTLSGRQAMDAVCEPGKIRCREDSSARPIINKETAASIIRLVAGANKQVSIKEVSVVPPLLSLVCEQLNMRRLNRGESTVGRDSLEDNATEVLNNFYLECFRPYPRVVRRYFESTLVSGPGVRETVTFDKVIADLANRNVKDPQEIVRQLVKKRLLSVEARAGVNRVELIHDVLAPIAISSREQDAFRSKRTKFIIFAVLSLLLAGGLFLWSSYLQAMLTKKTVALGKLEDRIRIVKETEIELRKTEIELRNEIEQLKAAKEKTKIDLKENEKKTKAKEEELKQKQLEVDKTQQDVIVANHQAQLAYDLAEAANINVIVAEARATEAGDRETQARIEFKRVEVNTKKLDIKLAGLNKEHSDDTSKTVFSIGLDAFDAEIAAGENGMSSQYQGRTKWHEAVAQWRRSLRLDGENRNAANALVATLFNRGSSKLNLPKMEDWKIDQQARRPRIAFDGSKVAYELDRYDVIVRTKERKHILHHGAGVKRIFQFYSDFLVSVDDSDLIHVWNSNTGKKECIVSVDGRVSSVVITPSRKELIVMSRNKQTARGTVRIFEVATGKQLSINNEFAYDNKIDENNFVRSGFRTFHQSQQGFYYALHDYRTGALKPRETAIFVDYSQQNNHVLAGNPARDDLILVRTNDIERVGVDKNSNRKNPRNPGMLPNVTISNSGKIVAVYGNRWPCVHPNDNDSIRSTRGLQLWDIENLMPIGQPLQHSQVVQNRVWFSKNDQYLVTTTQDNSIWVWDTTTRHLVHRYLHPCGLVDAGVNPDFTHVVTVGSDNLIRYWPIKKNPVYGAAVTKISCLSNHFILHCLDTIWNC